MYYQNIPGCAFSDRFSGEIDSCEKVFWWCSYHIRGKTLERWNANSTFMEAWVRGRLRDKDGIFTTETLNGVECRVFRRLPP